MVSTSTSPQVTTWKTDASHSLVEFSAKHMMFTTVKGRFSKVEGTIQLDENDITRSKIEAVIETTSLDTGDAGRDGHLRSADFFEVEKYPTATFRSTGIRQKGDDYIVTGDLDLHGVTRPVSLEVELDGRGTDPFGNEKIAFTGKTTINRKDFGLNWNVALEAGGVLVSENIKIELHIQAIKAQA